MFIHNKKKKTILSIVNVFIELICLPKRLFSGKVDIRSVVPGKILLIRLDHIGDVVMTSPSFYLLRDRFPEAKIFLLTNNAGRQLYQNDPAIDEVMVFNWPWGQQRIKQSFGLSRIKELLDMIRFLHREKIDLVVDFRGDLRFIILFGLLAGIRVKISNSRSGNSSLLDHVSNYDVSRHEVERSLDVIACFAKPRKPVRPTISLTDSEGAAVKMFIEKETGVPFSQKTAVIAPYSSRDVKSWPTAYFKDVIAHLVSENFTVLVVGTNDDKLHAEEMIKGFSTNVYSLAGRTSVRELAALASVSAIVIGVDTGVLHLASCFDIPIVAIFGSTRAIEFRPYSPYAVIADSQSCQCNQFLHLKCDYAVGGYSRCLQQLTPASLIAVIDTVL